MCQNHDEEEVLFPCTNCGAEESLNEHGMCDTCMDEHQTCEHCDDIVHNDDIHVVQMQNGMYSWRWTEGYVCESCRNDRYTLCDDCNQYYPFRRVIEVAGGHACPDCLSENYYCCNDCNDYFDADNIHEHDGDYYCESCLPKHNRKSSMIKNYSHKPTTRFYQLPNSDMTNWEYAPQNNEKEFYGIEVEVDNGDDLSDNVLEPLSQFLPHAYYKEDGSLSDDQGFEIVTHPCTYEYHMQSAYADAFKLLTRNGFRSHETETCGLHVHISRTSFGADANEQMYHLSRFMYLVEKFYAQIFKLSRRTQESMDRWAQRYGIEQQPEQMYRKNNGDDGLSSGRYYILNFQNTHTVEMRAFRGTLNVNTFKATLQLVKALKDLALTKRNLVNIEWKDFYKFAKAKGFSELTNYIFEKGLRPSESKLNEVEQWESDEIVEVTVVPTAESQAIEYISALMANRTNVVDDDYWIEPRVTTTDEYRAQMTSYIEEIAEENRRFREAQAILTRERLDALVQTVLEPEPPLRTDYENPEVQAAVYNMLIREVFGDSEIE